MPRIDEFSAENLSSEGENDGESSSHDIVDDNDVDQVGELWDALGADAADESLDESMVEEELDDEQVLNKSDVKSAPVTPTTVSQRSAAAFHLPPPSPPLVEAS